MYSNVTVSEFIIIFVSFLFKTVLRKYIQIDSLLSLSYSSIDNWASVLESNALLNANLPLYDGDNIHQPPLMIYIWSNVASLPNMAQLVLFGLIDAICIGLALRLTNEIISFYVSTQKKDNIGKSSLLISLENLRYIRISVCLWYAFNPFLIVSSLAHCTTNIYNLVLLVLFIQILKGNYKCGAMLCAWLTYVSFYPLVLLMALYSTVKWDVKKCIHISIVFFISCGSLLGISYVLVGSKFLTNVYLHHFYLNDSTPQLNIYWYMMSTMFDHFRIFFKCTFQLVLFSLCGGLSIKHSNDRVFLTYMLLWVITVLKPYPAIGEVDLRGGIVTFVMFLCVLCLGPLMQYLWMSSGTANANFYFAITLVHCAAQSHLASSILSGYAKYNFHLKHGKVIRCADGSEGQLRAK